MIHRSRWRWCRYCPHNTETSHHKTLRQIRWANVAIVLTMPMHLKVQDSKYSIECYHLAQKNYLKVLFFCDFDMILLWFCYGFDMVENMVFLWSETISWRRYEFRYGFVMVWTCLQPAYFDRTFQDMYLYYLHKFKLLLNLLKKKELQI